MVFSRIMRPLLYLAGGALLCLAAYDAVATRSAVLVARDVFVGGMLLANGYVCGLSPAVSKGTAGAWLLIACLIAGYRFCERPVHVALLAPIALLGMCLMASGMHMWRSEASYRESKPQDQPPADAPAPDAPVPPADNDN